MEQTDSRSDQRAQARAAELRRAEAHYRGLLAEQSQRPQAGDGWPAARRRRSWHFESTHLYALGEVYAEQGHACAAAACFEQVLADENNAGACLRLGDSLMDAHDYDRGVAAYRHALTLRVPFPETV